jgi:hypothetical protein
LGLWPPQSIRSFGLFLPLCLLTTEMAGRAWISHEDVLWVPFLPGLREKPLKKLHQREPNPQLLFKSNKKINRSHSRSMCSLTCPHVLSDPWTLRQSRQWMYYQTHRHERKFDQRKGCHRLGLELRRHLRGVERQSGRRYNPAYIYSSINCCGIWRNLEPSLYSQTK